MTQEEKSKAYDGNYKTYTELINRLEGVKDAIKKQNYGIAMDILYKPYPEYQITASPELKESDDEKIRKAIGYAIGQSTHSDGTLINGVSSEEALSWLEKRGEQKTIDEIAEEVCKNKTSAMAFLKSAGIINENGELAEQYRQSEQNFADKVEPKFKIGQTIKKEGFNLGFIIVKIEDGFYYNEVGDNFPFTDQDNWELVEQKQDINIQINPSEYINDMGGNGCYLKNTVQTSTWSEEDRDYYDAIIAKLEVTQDDALLTDNQMKFLKSLKDRYTWKPSNEQMEGIECTIKTLRYQLNAGDNRLDSLYNDLKKLREK